MGDEDQWEAPPRGGGQAIVGEKVHSDEKTDPSVSAAEVATGYKELAEAEVAFRTLKQTLELRPFYHRTEERITAHVLLCWLGLLLIRLTEKETG